MISICLSGPSCTSQPGEGLRQRLPCLGLGWAGGEVPPGEPGSVRLPPCWATRELTAEGHGSFCCVLFLEPVKVLAYKRYSLNTFQTNG